MGVIDLVCVTTDPGATTYYGLAYADDYGQGSKRINYAVLIKSNTKPISPGDLTWSVVSMFDSSKLAGDPYSVTAADCSCVINEQGVFTMFGLSAGAMSTTASTFPFGIRYDPTSGAWMNVTVNAGYTWSGVFSRRSLGYVNNGTSKVLVHASISTSNNTIYLATVIESTRTLSPKALWTMNTTIHGMSIEALAIGNDQLYALGQDRTVLLHDYEYAEDPGTLTTFPLSAISLSTPASKGRLQDTSLKCNTFPTQVLYVLNGSLTLLCGREPEIIGDSPITTGWILPIKDYKNSSALSILDWFYVNITSMDYFVPIGNYTGSSTIGLFKKEDTMYTFGNDNGSWYTHLVDDVNITNSLGVDPNPPLASPSSPLLSTGAIVGIVVGVVVVLAGTVFLLLRVIRKSKNKVNITTAAVVKDDSATAEDGDKNASFRKSGDSGEPNYLYLDGKHPYWRPSSTESLPLASMTPVPEHLQERLRVLQEQMRAVQAQIRVTTQFSSHPRPNVVTTLSKQGEPTASGASESNSASGNTTATTTRKGSLESIPYVPLSSLPESTYLGYSSAPAYSNVIAQPSSQDSPEVAPQEFVESSETVASLPVPSSAVGSGFHSMQS
ncbi:hypothetical protein BKA57DRAFT_491810 [Linnemannia elongata]|nr:hypothetical protein BKA57DRAFT_491810 [Linnemannia elongata]